HRASRNRIACAIRPFQTRIRHDARQTSLLGANSNDTSLRRHGGRARLRALCLFLIYLRQEILMSTSDKAMTASSSVYATGVFWERLWRMSGINFVVFFIIAYVIYGNQPHVGASADALVAFYDGDRTRILIAAVFSGLAVLNLLWFAAALRTTLADAGQAGWGVAATASSV